MMTKQSFVIVAALAFVFGIGTLTASAQGQVLKADIPFEFTVGKATLPAGEYLIKLPETGGARVVTFKKADGEAHALVLTNPVNSKGAEIASGLVFVKAGDEYLLYQVHTEGRETGLEVIRSKRMAGTELARKTVEFKMAKSE
jgi:hypothetical protein